MPSADRRFPITISPAPLRDAGTDAFVSSFHDAGGVRLHVRRKVVAGAAAPCVLLHGLALSHRSLMPTARLLGPRSVHVPDLAGYGLSGKPAQVFDVAQQATVVIALLESLDAGPAAVLGHSFGSQVAVEVALRRPDLVAAVILAGLCTDPAGATSRQQIGRLLRSVPFESPRQALILAADIRDAGPRRILRTLRHAVADHVQPKLAALKVPALLIRGRRDYVAPQDWQDHAATLIPSVHTVTVDHAAHNVVVTAGPQTAAAVRDFLTARNL